MDKMDNYVSYCARIKNEYNAACQCLKILEEAKETGPKQFDMITEYMLDWLKYKIPNAQYKPWVLRKMERKFKTVDEIEGLIGIMNI